MRIARAVLATLILACLSAPVLAAQDTTTVQRSAWLVGPSVGVPGHATHPEPTLFTIGVHGTKVQPGRVGADLFAGIMPRLLGEGVLAVGAHGGLTLPVALSEEVMLMPSGGASLIAGFATIGGGVETGMNIGAAVLVLGDGDAGLRAGTTWHRFRGFGNAIWLFEFGFVRWRGTR